jgi:hypothetical protein
MKYQGKVHLSSFFYLDEEIVDEEQGVETFVAASQEAGEHPYVHNCWKVVAVVVVGVVARDDDWVHSHS